MSTYFDLPRPRVLAHRGLATEAPENTLLAFERAAAVGAAYIETDVHVSADGVAVVAHDPSLRRVAGRDAAVSELSMAELRRVDLGAGQGFASLEEALGAFPDLRFNIDVKVAGAVGPAVTALERTGAAGRALLTSFSDRRRRRLGRLVPQAVTSAGRTGVISTRLASSIHWRAVVSLARRGAAALQVPERVGSVRLVTAGFVRAVQRAGAEVHVWTVNDPADMTRLLDLGVDGLVTDRADLAVPLIAARS
ncbi:glycerophosphodiester phosphodiesterase family protein [Agromyces bauzanensis]|uniref:Glycerophosphoryl diester phosphodiesterase n=1 Tax=Agromyces bauzanensis TaxID=1308924 RepID=A0A917UQT3_9MICO|nr:glycerophosphodiester phosphodiesterase family protein [Agromyces bauzanensis]GGJ77250.1 glycerophosphoryl diester phosphodiesterase [Agromyces bauzanensis]